MPRGLLLLHLLLGEPKPRAEAKQKKLVDIIFLDVGELECWGAHRKDQKIHPLCRHKVLNFHYSHLFYICSDQQKRRQRKR